jgi:TorA maturation chaperone TorD
MSTKDETMAISLEDLSNEEFAEAQVRARDAHNLDRETVVAALDLLAHWWSRPLQGEVDDWVRAAEIEAEVRCAMRYRQGETSLSELASTSTRLLDEHERLFIGPGPVNCPPYESYWRDDVPVDIRRSLMGPCTAELRQQYAELGLEMAPDVGELPDHVSVELEAVAFALTSESTTAIGREIFLDHLRRFMLRLCRSLAHAADDPFYRDLARVSADWLALIQRYFEVTADGCEAAK